MRKPILERFLAKIDIKENGCWEWQGTIDEKGYGLFWNGVKTIRAHRYSYEWFNQYKLPKYDPNGLQLDHLCRNRKCLNPNHLELIMHYKNIKRGESGINHKSKTHCPKGHPYDDKNTYIQPNGSRACKICSRENYRMFYTLRHPNHRVNIKREEK
jgi:hypothetical protein